MASVEIATVQHVPKKSSDELLSKFADESGDEEEAPPRKLELQVVAKRRKRSRKSRGDSGDHCESPTNCGARLGERHSLLPPVSRRSALLRQLGISRSQIRARGIRNKSLLGAIEKTWRRTIEGASKVFVEKHYNRHKRLINDIA